MQNKDDYTVKETGIWFLTNEKIKNGLEENGEIKTVLEIKCPFMGGKPVPCRNVCINHVPQIMLKMFCTSTEQCYKNNVTTPYCLDSYWH